MNRSIADQSILMRRRIAELPEAARAAVAAGAAWRLMEQHLSLPEERRSAFTTSWAEAVSMLWEGVSDQSAVLSQMLGRKLGEYYASPYCHKLGEKALPGADDDAASAAIYATEAYYMHDARAASFAAMQLLTQADARADAISEASREDLMSSEARGRRAQLQQIELDRLDGAVSLLEDQGLNERTLARLREIFA